MSPLRMAAVAASFDRDLEADFALIGQLIDTARAAGVRLLALPEAALGGYLVDLDGAAGTPPALSPDGPEIRRLAQLAGDMVVAVGYCEQGCDQLFNSAVCVSGDGMLGQQVLGRHRKVHQPLREDASYGAGDRFAAFDTPVGRLGMMICYDKAFPESARALALDGADVVLCLSAWPASCTDPAPTLEQDRWKRRFDLFDRVRALENQIVWLSANQSGQFGSLRFVASAKVVDPGGEILADTGVRPGLAIAELDVQQALERARHSMAHLHDRRPDAYTGPTPPELNSRAFRSKRRLVRGTLRCMVTLSGVEQGKRVMSARDYLRVSLDRSGRARSLEEQHADHVRVAGEQGWTLGECSYRDESVSASRYSSKVRGGFDALIADLEADRFGAGVLMIWESSRGSRRVGEWVRLLELCEQRSVWIFVTTHGRCYDPGNGRDRRSLLEDAVDSEYESAKMSTRGRRAAAANAVAGRPHGRIPYGYRRVFDPQTRVLLAQEPEPGEAEVVAELYRRLIQGHSLKGIARDLGQRGIRTRSGAVWTPQHLRSLAIKPVYAGLRSHNPGGSGAGRLVDLDGLLEGQWPGLVSRAEWFAVQRLLRAPERKTTRPGRAKHLLSHIGRCGVCEAVLTVAYRDSGADPLYLCGSKGCVRISQAALDALAEQVMLDFLARPDVIGEILAGENADQGELSGVRDQLAAVRARHEQLADAVAAGTVSVATLVRAEPPLLAEITTLETRQRGLSTPSALRGLIEPGADVAERWATTPMSTRRQVARLLLTPTMVGQLRLKPTPRRGRIRVPAIERIQWWRG